MWSHSDCARTHREIFTATDTGYSLHVLLSVCVCVCSCWTAVCAITHRFVLHKMDWLFMDNLSVFTIHWWLGRGICFVFLNQYTLQLIILFIMSLQHSSCCENLCNVMLPKLLKSFIPGVYERQSGFGIMLMGKPKAYHTQSSSWSSHHCFLHYHNLHCTSLLHPAIPVYTVLVRTTEVQWCVVNG